MMRWIIDSSMKFRLLVVAIAIGLMVVGATRLPDAPVDVLPEFSPPYVEVQTEALGLSAPEVENLVSVNIEELLNATPWLESIKSTSVPGLSSVVLTFEAGTDVLRARQLIAERLALAYALPNVSSPPSILQPLSSTSRVLTLSLASKNVSQIQMSVLTRWTIRPALLAVPGVANVAVWGFRDRQLQVQIDPRRLKKNGVSIDQIIRTAGNAMWVSPLTYLEASTPGTGGWIDTPQQRLEVRHVFPITDPAGLAKVTLDGRNQTLGSVAKVVEGHPPLIGDAVLKAGPGLLLVVEKFPNANAREVTEGVEKALAELAPGLKGIETDTTIFRPASYIASSIDNLSLALLIGAGLGLLVILAMLYQWRVLVVSAIAIATSLVAAGLVLNSLGGTFNAMILAGLVIALVVIVDEAIVGVDHVMTRLRERRATGSDQTTVATIRTSLLESNRLGAYTTAIVLLPLLPAVFMTGVSASLFQPLALAFTVAVLAAIVVALTLTPALTSLLFSAGRVDLRESPVAAWLKRVYEKALDRVLGHGTPTFVAALGLAAVAIVAAPFLDRTTLPDLREPNVVVRWDGPPGTSAPEMTRITTRFAQDLKSVPGVQNVAGQVGRAVLGDKIGNVNAAEVFVRIEEDADYEAALSAVREKASGYPGVTSDVRTFEDFAIGRARTGGSRDPVVVNVFGPRFDVLQAKAEEIRGALADIGGVDSINVERQVMQPQVEVKVNLARAQRFGLKPGDVRREAGTLLAGLEVGSLYEAQKTYQVAVWSTPSTRTSLTDINSLMIDTPKGGQVALGKVADVALKPSPTVIRRQAVSRRVQVGLNVPSRDIDSVISDVKSRLTAIDFPLEYHAEVRGESSDSSRSRALMIAAGIAAAIGIFLLLQAALGSWGMAGIFFLTLPASLAGGVLAASWAGDAATLGTVVAFLAVLAVAARNGLRLVDHLRQLEREGVPFSRDLVIRGARERVVPILVTTFTIGLALLPLVITGGTAGQEIANPAAVIILGGLVTSTLVSLFLIPALYLRFGSRFTPQQASV